MGFREDLQRLSIQVGERKVHITNEEMTKQALIIPFLQVLGYDVFNPLEVRPEYTADFGKKKGEKVDYALFKDDTPIVFIEAKSVDENLSNHDAQLSRYFNAVQDIRLGILTNGIDYKFFTDLTADNIMDDNPFLVVNMLNLKDSDIENLTKFRKDSFDTEFLVKYAEELVYTSALDDTLKELFRNPNDEFIRFLIKDFSNSRITTNVIDRFRPIVKKAISNAVLDIVSKGLFQDETAVVKEVDDVNKADSSKDVESETTEITNESPRKKIVETTDDELKCFEIIKDIITSSGRSAESVNYKDTVNYFSVNYNSITKWFLRIQLDVTNKNIMTKLDVDTAQSLSEDFKVEQAPKSQGESRVYINSYEDIRKLDKLVLACFDNISK